MAIILKHEFLTPYMLVQLNCVQKAKVTGCPGSNFPISNRIYSETMHVRPQLSKAKIGLTMEQFFCTFHLILTIRYKNNKLDPIFQSSFRGLVDKRLECHAIGPGFESYSGH